MKRIAIMIVLALALVAAVPAFAQNSGDIITLNDATPAIDVVISLPADTTGTVALDVSMALVTLLDANGSSVFSAGDARIHALELNIAPNSGSHTLRVERMPGAAEAHVRIASLPEMTLNGTAQLITGLVVGMEQEVSLPLSTDHPGDTVSVNIPAETMGVLTATFPGAAGTSQLIDGSGLMLAQSVGGHVDGLNVMLDGGDYLFTLLGTNLVEPVVAGVRTVSADSAGFALMLTPESATTVTTADTTNATTSTVSVCNAVITSSSVNLRSGPGTGYSVLDYGYRNQTMVAGGRNIEDNWVLVGMDTGSAWVASMGVQLQGECGALAVYDIPLRDAQPAPLVITVPNQAGGFGEAGEYEDEEHEEGENEEGDDD